jgi:invasion protein IalB
MTPRLYQRAVSANTRAAADRASRVLIAALLMAASVADLAHAQKAPDKAKPAAAPAAGAPTAEAASPASWVVTCNDRAQGKLACEMAQLIIEQSSRREVMMISVKGASDGPSSAMLFRLFHGVYLPGGVTVSVDTAAPTPIAFQKSDAVGVYAALPLTDKLIADMGKGKTLVVRAELNKGEPVELTALLNGFAPALEKVRSTK